MKQEIEARALTRAISLLTALGARYGIVLPSGEVIGERLAETPQARTRKKPQHPTGTLTNHFRPYVEGLQPGQSAEIPLGGFGQGLQNALTGWAAKKWGSGNYITSVDKPTQTLTVIRSA
jgi:hypothetical protein